MEAVPLRVTLTAVFAYSNSSWAGSIAFHYINYASQRKVLWLSQVPLVFPEEPLQPFCSDHVLLKTF